MRNLFNLFLASISGIMMFLLFTHLNNDEQVDFIQGGDIAKAQTIDSLQHIIDSLHSENYPCQVELHRHRVAYQIFMRRNPSGAKEYGTIISNEIE
jgi:hypothetical protein